MAHILVIDDEWDILDFVTEELKGMGHTVIGLNSAESALDLLELSCNHFDVILSDVMMPRKNGLDFLREVMGKPNCKHTVFGLMSSYTNELQEEILRMGVRHSLHKPFTQQQLKDFTGVIAAPKKVSSRGA